MPTQSVSTIQNKQQLDATHFLLVASNPVKIFNIEGYVGGTANTQYYIQLLGTATPASGTTVPLWSKQVIGMNGFAFDYNEIGIDTARLNALNGSTTTDGDNNLPVYAAISSTNGVWTSVAASTDIEVDFEQFDVEPLNVNVTNGSITGPMFTVWTASTANRLTSFSYTNTTGNTVYLMLFGTMVTIPGMTPLQSWKMVNGSAVNLDFGKDGLEVFQPDSNYVNQTDCVFKLSSTPVTITPTNFEITPNAKAGYITLLT